MISATNDVADESDPSVPIPVTRLDDSDQPPRTSHQEEERRRSGSSSKRQMLAFALPALGIYLCNPLLSNIDNAFVGRTVGTTGLAALAPATTCTDQMLYLFSFLGRATTGIVARAYGGGDGKSRESDGTKEARESASARTYISCRFLLSRFSVCCYILRLMLFLLHTRTHPHTALSVALLCGLGLTLFYAVGTPALLAALRVEPALRPAAASYIYWRGAIAWAALAQSVCLSILMATRDAITPLKIIGLAASLNIVADALLCAWPFRWGCSGAAAATSLATLVSCGFMIRALAEKQLLPQVRLPTRPEMWALLAYTGPLIAIPITRLAGFIVMQKKAMQLGVESLAGYQLGINILMFFLLFGEPLSQLSQTNLPALLDQENAPAVKSTLKGALTLAVFTSIVVAGAAFSTARFGVGLFTSDVGVQMVTQGASLSLLIAVATSVFTVAVDGAMFAARDFGFMLAFGFTTFLCQLAILPHCHSVAAIVATFTFRLGSYALAALGRMALGYGAIGKLIRRQVK
jgi:Na+-driven multidrug efflux pump